MINIINDLNKDLGLNLNLKPDYLPHHDNTDSSLPPPRCCRLYRADNVLALNHLVTQNEQFDFCYIDPPYNTKNKFIYNDSRKSKKHPIWGSHCHWIEFMAERLIPLRLLMKESGIVAISIDDNEQPYLRILMDKIFGERNFIACISVCRSKNGKGSKFGISTNHEYVVIYGKSQQAQLLGCRVANHASYNKQDQFGKYKINGLLRKKGEGSLQQDRPTMFYPLYFDSNGKVFTENVSGRLKETYPIDNKGIKRRWLWSKNKVLTESWKLYASETGVIYVKNYLTEGKRVKPKSSWQDNRHLTERATNQIKEIYGEKIFDTPKSVDLIQDIIDIHANDNARIIDFFAGTGTTAHAAHNLNVQYGGNRHVVLVEQPQTIAKSHLAYQQGYKEIADITEARLAWLRGQDNRFDYDVVTL